MNNFGEEVLSFNRSLHFKDPLPPGIRIMHPFKESTALASATAFYRKYYNDNLTRRLILGINPGRFGAGVTGVPFTDPKRLVEMCGIPFDGPLTHEPSSVFIYDMIAAYGGTEKFYRDFYISSVCPLGFTSVKENGREVNYNYYDSRELQESVYDFMLKSTRRQLKFNLDKAIVFCFGTGKNESFIRKMNDTHKLFGRLTALEHPRYIMQYKLRQKSYYIDKYLQAFAGV